MAAASAVALSVLGVGLAAPTASAATQTVSIQNLQYNPPSITVNVGDTVVWSNDETSNTTHSVTGDPLNSPDLPQGAKYSFTFTSPGTYGYHCRFHPDMQGQVVVNGGGGGTTTTAPPPTSTGTSAPPTSTTSATTAAPPTTTGGGSGGGGSTSSPTGGGLPVGAGPAPVSFQLTDNNGSWYDTHLNLGPLGGQSLAVAELPRVNLNQTTGGVGGINPTGIVPSSSTPPTSSSSTGSGGLPGLPGAGSGSGGGLSLGAASGGTASSGSAPAAPGSTGSLIGSVLGGGSLPLLGGGSVPVLGSGLLGGDATKGLLGIGSSSPASALGLNVAAMRTAISQLLPAGDPNIARSNAILTEFSKEVAAQPAGVPLNIGSLPIGPDLQGLLADAQKWATNTVSLPVTANFEIKAPQAASAHTITSLIWPEGAKGFPFDEPGAFVGQTSVQLTEPGLYAFACKIHPYMLGAIVVDDPLTPGLDFGKKLRVNSRALDVPSNADVIMQLVDKFFTITVPSNWQHFSDTQDTTWDPSFPPAPILTYNSDGNPELIPSLDQFFKGKFQTPKTLPATKTRPATPGVGEVWIDTEMEEYAHKTKVGAVTKINTQNWDVERKVALPQVNMNNPHNNWTDKNEKYIYVNEWFNNKTDVFDRATGAFVRQIEVGPDPSHVMTRTDTDQLHVAINGGSAVMELAPGATKIDRRIPVQGPGEKIAHPHAHWMTGDGKTMITPNVNTYDATVVDIPSGNIRKEQTSELPIASGMTPDGSKAYEADFLGMSVSCISLQANACVDGSSKVHHKEIDLWKNYDPVKGANGPFGGLDIQIPVAPDNSAVLVANTLTGNITVIDPKTDEIVKWLPCDAGCHGINFGAKKGGGYYAYVTSKFSNAMEIIDTDPNGDGDPSDATVVGKMTVSGGPNTQTDDQISNYAGYGGMGVLPIPLAYEGWVEKAPSNPINDQLTCRQRNPVKYQQVCQ
ncbi:cupredoxin domain-containing protein [Gandjariella thermophila]|uniref:cupredoxin domain-containing protein n=1 Tax=Gandjariella thermophila TaxID=1931992 RepID=UPI0010F6E089|nr:cupredoxin domain-containing protein [Gandjariella thermophila]